MTMTSTVLDGEFVTDAGLETELLFHDGIDLPLFAAFPLVERDDGRQRLARYYDGFAAVARRHGVGVLLETPTWRANPDWATALGYDADRLRAVNQGAVYFVRALADRWPDVRSAVSGMVGPRHDGYRQGRANDADEAAAYHRPQLAAFAEAGADVATAYTLGDTGEAIGIARAATDVGLPVALSFTVETDGRLPSGQRLGEAIAEVDRATGEAPRYYLLNCAHPSHLVPAIEPGADWTTRIAGLRPNASAKSHAELDESTELDAGDPDDLAARCVALRDDVPSVRILGGCCGTDARHVAALWAAWTRSPR